LPSSNPEFTFQLNLIIYWKSRLDMMIEKNSSSTNMAEKLPETGKKKNNSQK